MADCQGLPTGLLEATNLLTQDEAKWKVWVNLLLRASTEPTVGDMAEHILYIGKASVANNQPNRAGLKAPR